MFSARAKTKYLVGLCHRVSTELTSGIDVRKTWQREAERARGGARSRIEDIRLSISQGDTLTDAVNSTGAYFPPLFRKLVEVGEETGHLAEVFRRLADNYDHQIQTRRQFLQSITWPMLQLTIALSVIGILIFAMGIIEKMTGTRTDILGWGLIGLPGLIVYLSAIGCVIAVIAVCIRAIRRGALWITPVQFFVMRIPGFGRAIKTMAIARFSWTLHVTLESGMEIRKAVSLAIDSTQNAYYKTHNDRITRELTMGRELHEAMGETGAFSPEFTDAIEVGERSGRLVESLAVLSKQYQEQAIFAINYLTRGAGVAILLLVAITIIMLIFRVFSFYAGILNEATKGF